MNKNFIIISSVITFLLFFSSCYSNSPNNSKDNSVYRGIVLYPSDIISVGIDKTIEIMKQADLNLLGIHAQHKHENLSKVKDFIESKDGQYLIKKCKGNNIFIEFEVHALNEILPRKLFKEHPEFFRVDENGKRNNDLNMCFSCQEAYHEIEKSISELTKWLKPTTHRYYFWTDDITNAFCNCELCSEYSESEQALLYENKLLTILRKFDSSAILAHLAYHNTLKAPKKVIPMEGIFLEYAPIGRDYSKPLSNDHVNDLKQNLEVFPVSTVHLLEYWLDVSMFSGWNRDKLVKVPWDKDYFIRDINFYSGLGIESVTTFGVLMINDLYIQKFGEEHTKMVINQYGKELKKYLN